MTKLDKTGKEVLLPTVAIPQEYHHNEQEFIAPPIHGFVGTNTDRKTYSTVESASISNTVKGDKTKAPVYNGSSTVA